jgi:hypothetical protein
VAIPRSIDAGTYRIVVETTLNQKTVARERAFVVLPQ